MSTIRLPATACPCCGHLLDAASGVEPGAMPKTDDVSVCWHCAAMLVFADDAGAVRELTQADMDALDTDTLILVTKAQAAVRNRLARQKAEEAAKAKESAAPPRSKMDKMMPSIAKALDMLFVTKLGHRMPFMVMVEEEHGMNFISNYDDAEAMEDLRRFLQTYDEKRDKMYRIDRDGCIAPAFDAGLKNAN